jgi:predicted nucleic acid-binding protein
MTEKNRQTEGFDFSNKCALLDTNILKELLTAEKQSSRFSEVFEFLRATNSFPYIIRRITDFEFVGYSTNKKAYDLASSWIGEFDGLPPMPQDFETATLLSSMYKCKNPSINPKQISFVDCMYAAQLVRVKERAFIVTTDLNDYPSFLFDMPKHFAIEEPGGQIKFVGLKVFNQNKYDELERSFSRSGHSSSN